MSQPCRGGAAALTQPLLARGGGVGDTPPQALPAAWRLGEGSEGASTCAPTPDEHVRRHLAEREGGARATAQIGAWLEQTSVPDAAPARPTPLQPQRPNPLNPLAAAVPATPQEGMAHRTRTNSHSHIHSHIHAKGLPTPCDPTPLSCGSSNAPPSGAPPPPPPAWPQTPQHAQSVSARGPSLAVSLSALSARSSTAPGTPADPRTTTAELACRVCASGHARAHAHVHTQGPRPAALFAGAPRGESVETRRPCPRSWSPEHPPRRGESPASTPPPAAAARSGSYSQGWVIEEEVKKRVEAFKAEFVAEQQSKVEAAEKMVAALMQKETALLLQQERFRTQAEESVASVLEAQQQDLNEKAAADRAALADEQAAFAVFKTEEEARLAARDADLDARHAARERDINAAFAAQQAELDAAGARLHQEVTALRASLDATAQEKDAEFASLQAALTARGEGLAAEEAEATARRRSLDEHAARNAAATREHADRVEALRLKTDQLADLERAIQERDAAVGGTEAALEATRGELDALAASLEAQEKKIAAEAEGLSEERAALDALRRDMSDLEEQLEARHDAIACAEEALAQQQIRAAAEARGAEEAFRAREAAVARAEQQVDTGMKEAKEAVFSLRAAAQKESDDIRAALRKQEEVNAAETARVAAALGESEALVAENKRYEQRLREREAALDAREGSVAAQFEEQEKALQAMVDRVERDRDAVKSAAAGVATERAALQQEERPAMEAALRAQLEQELQAGFAALRGEHAAKLDKLQAGHAADRVAWQTELDSLQASHAADRAAWQTEVDTTTAGLRATHAAERDAWVAEAGDLNAARAAWRAEVEATAADAAARQREEREAVAAERAEVEALQQALRVEQDDLARQRAAVEAEAALQVEAAEAAMARPPSAATTPHSSPAADEERAEQLREAEAAMQAARQAWEAQRAHQRAELAAREKALSEREAAVASAAAAPLQPVNPHTQPHAHAAAACSTPHLWEKEKEKEKHELKPFHPLPHHHLRTPSGGSPGPGSPARRGSEGGVALLRMPSDSLSLASCDRHAAGVSTAWIVEHEAVARVMYEDLVLSTLETLHVVFFLSFAQYYQATAPTVITINDTVDRMLDLRSSSVRSVATGLPGSPPPRDPSASASQAPLPPSVPPPQAQAVRSFSAVSSPSPADMSFPTVVRVPSPLGLDCSMSMSMASPMVRPQTPVCGVDFNVMMDQLWAARDGPDTRFEEAWRRVLARVQNDTTYATYIGSRLGAELKISRELLEEKEASCRELEQARDDMQKRALDLQRSEDDLQVRVRDLTDAKRELQMKCLYSTEAISAREAEVRSLERQLEEARGNDAWLQKELVAAKRMSTALEARRKATCAVAKRAVITTLILDAWRVKRARVLAGWEALKKHARAQQHLRTRNVAAICRASALRKLAPNYNLMNRYYKLLLRRPTMRRHAVQLRAASHKQHLSVRFRAWRLFVEDKFLQGRHDRAFAMMSDLRKSLARRGTRKTAMDRFDDS